MIIVSSNYSVLFPASIVEGLLMVDDTNSYEILQSDSNSYEWGSPNRLYVLSDSTEGVPTIIHMVWLSATEKCFYSITSELSVSKMIEAFKTTFDNYDEQSYEYIVVGLAPFGKTAIWIHGDKKSTLIDWLEGEFLDIDFESVFQKEENQTLPSLCQSILEENIEAKQNLATNGLPPRDLFDNYMKQFTYRYLPLFEHWDEDEQRWLKYTEEEQATQPQFDYIEEALYDGTHDKLHDGGLLNYHQAGKPKKLAVKWHIKKSEHAAYFWFEDEMIRSIFDRFYGLHPDTKTDFILHFDPTKNKYQLSLYRYGLREPQILPEESYQLIVFKNKFEHFRSENYDQPRGAWIW